MSRTGVLVAGVTGIEPATDGFGIRCATNCAIRPKELTRPYRKVGFLSRYQRYSSKQAQSRRFAGQSPDTQVTCGAVA